MKFLKRSGGSSRGVTKSTREDIGTQPSLDRSLGPKARLPSTITSSERTSNRSILSGSKNLGSQSSILDATTGVGMTASSSLLRSSNSSEPKRTASVRRSFIPVNGSADVAVDSSIVKAAPLRNSRTIDRQSKYNAFMSSKLRFDMLGLVGRIEEQQVLFEALDRAYNGSRELIFISGESGAGKTALAGCLKKRIKLKNDEGAFVSGKFNPEDQTGVPYRAIAHACSQILQVIYLGRTGSEKHKERFVAVKTEIKEKFGDINEGKVLGALIPELNHMLYDRSASDNSDDVSSIGSSVNSIHEQESGHLLGNEQQKARFTHAFRTFFQIVNAAIHPLCVVLDDMHWSDSASVELLETLITDISNSDMAVVCLYRSNELDDLHPFSQLIREVEKKKRVHGFQTTDLAMENLNVSHVHELLLELLNYDHNESYPTLPLAELCHKRTLGNPLYAVSFFRQLFDENMLNFDLGKNCWTWDIEQILSQTFAMKNVVELMTYEMAKLPAILQRRLCIAACLGNSFHESVLNAVLEKMEEKEDSSMIAAETVTGHNGDEEKITLENWLSFSESCGFLEQQVISRGAQAKSYQWIHDSVREGALALLPRDTLSELKGQLGRQLYKSLSGEELESVTFMMANLLHDGPATTDKAERIVFARINLEAAQKATHVSAFSTAAQYATRGIDLLPVEKWETHVDLTLELYTIAAITEDKAGLRESVDARYQEVAARDDIPLASKLEIYVSQIRSLCATTDRNDGIELTMAVLEQQGIKFPKTTAGRMFSTINLLLKVKKKCRELTVTDLAQLPEMEYADILKMKLLHHLAIYCYASEQYGIIMPLAVLTSASLSFKHGVSMFAPPNLATLGVVFAGVMHDYQLGGKMGYLAMNLLEQRNFGSTASYTIFTVYQFLRCWLDPLSSCQPQYMRGYECGLVYGDTEFSSFNVFAYITSGFQAGRPLNQLESDCRIYAPQLRPHIARYLSPYWLAFVKLIGCEEQTDPLLGDTEATMSLDDLAERHKDMEAFELSVAALHSRLHAIFGDHEAGAELAIERGDDFEKKNPALHIAMPETFARGVSLYAMAIKTRHGKYKRHARKVHTTIKKWRKAGNPNVIGYEKMLDAEEAVLKGKFEAACSLYHSAKVISSRSGLVQEAALAAERCGEMLLQRDSPSDSKALLEEAVKLYRIWGADAKAEQLFSTGTATHSSIQQCFMLLCERDVKTTSSYLMQRPLYATNDGDGTMHACQAVPMFLWSQASKTTETSN
ncbi:Transcriptional regulator [Seminavis robusta]|uniref:Transcriptional regulator n=1 Tax=Seminavis robusta TaxID=568900 RepID=A0A9N8HRC7_9STRA|nr:Transcriptional regulator [Seminavis robusta]|eukprot:Sro1257_g256720.1 Transcriptional regulator (1252) ;mRNA; r:8445-12342